MTGLVASLALMTACGATATGLQTTRSVCEAPVSVAGPSGEGWVELAHALRETDSNPAVDPALTQRVLSSARRAEDALDAGHRSVCATAPASPQRRSRHACLQEGRAFFDALLSDARRSAFAQRVRLPAALEHLEIEVSRCVEGSRHELFADAEPANARSALASFRAALAVSDVDALQRRGAALARASTEASDPRVELRIALARASALLTARDYAGAERAFDGAATASRSLGVSEGGALRGLAAARAALDRDAEAVSVLERVVEIASDPWERASAYVRLASVLTAVDDHEHAVHFAQQALELHRSLLRDGHPVIGRDLFVLANAAFWEGRRDVAAEYLREARQLALAALGPAHPEQAVLLSALARSHYERAEFAEAAERAGQAASIARTAATGQDRSVGWAQLVRGMSLWALARRARPEAAAPAEEALGAALASFQELGASAAVDAVTARSVLGELYLETGRPADAVVVLEPAVVQGRELSAVDTASLAAMERDLARAYGSSERCVDAMPLLDAAIERLEQARQEFSLERALARLSRARCRRELGDAGHVDELRAAVSALRGLLPQDDPLLRIAEAELEVATSP